MSDRFPLAPIAHHLGIELGGPGGGPRIGDIHPTGATLLAEHLGVSPRTVRRLAAGGLTEHQADRYAVAAGTLPELLWPDWARQLDRARLVGAAAVNAAKDRCPAGHEYDRTTREGWRRCSSCRTSRTAAPCRPLSQPAHCTTEDSMPDDQLLTKREVARRWKVSTRTVEREVADGRLAAVKVRGQVRYRLVDVEAAEQAAAR